MRNYLTALISHLNTYYCIDSQMEKYLSYVALLMSTIWRLNQGAFHSWWFSKSLVYICALAVNATNMAVQSRIILKQNLIDVLFSAKIAILRWFRLRSRQKKRDSGIILIRCVEKRTTLATKNAEFWSQNHENFPENLDKKVTFWAEKEFFLSLLQCFSEKNYF